jgi:hypothetical protein
MEPQMNAGKRKWSGSTPLILIRVHRRSSAVKALAFAVKTPAFRI